MFTSGIPIIVFGIPLFTGSFFVFFIPRYNNVNAKTVWFESLFCTGSKRQSRCVKFTVLDSKSRRGSNLLRSESKKGYSADRVRETFILSLGCADRDEQISKQWPFSHYIWWGNEQQAGGCEHQPDHHLCSSMKSSYIVDGSKRQRPYCKIVEREFATLHCVGWFFRTQRTLRVAKGWNVDVSIWTQLLNSTSLKVVIWHPLEGAGMKSTFAFLLLFKFGQLQLVKSWLGNEENHTVTQKAIHPRGCRTDRVYQVSS